MLAFRSRPPRPGRLPRCLKGVRPRSLTLELLHCGDEHSRRFGEKLMASSPAATPSDWMTTSAPVSARFTVASPSASPAIFFSLQAPAHLIIPDNGQQTAMQDDDLFAKRPPDNEHRLDQHRQGVSHGRAAAASFVSTSKSLE